MGQWFKYMCAVAVAALMNGCMSISRSPCSTLEQFHFEDAQISSVKSVGAGRSFSFQGMFMGMPFFVLPASCRVALVLKPTPESHIKAEVWLPQTDWNGKFLGIGNGGFAGSIDTMSLTVALQRGYAAASTDTGHVSSGRDGTWALNQREKIRDYGYRAIHETTVKAKQLIEHFYGRSQDYAYFSGCSNGGRAALMEAQRYPDDYDGIVAGAPAYFPSSTLPVWASIQQQLVATPGAWIPPKKIELIASKVLLTCDALDGVEDGVIDDPRQCPFNSESLLCSNEATNECLTAAQVKSLNAIYSGPGGQLNGFPNRGFSAGGELADNGGWADWIIGSKPSSSIQYNYSLEFNRYLVFNDPNWMLGDFELARDQTAMRNAFRGVLDAVDADLSEFKARGGKLILYHGWSDAALPPEATIDYYEAVRNRMGHSSADEFVRLYMVPGMQHCFGGPGADNFGNFPPAGNADPLENVNAALEAWVEHGQKPESIIAKKFAGNEFKALIAPESGEVIFSRPLCPYPQVARPNEKGSAVLAANFSCVQPKVTP